MRPQLGACYSEASSLRSGGTGDPIPVFEPFQEPMCPDGLILRYPARISARRAGIDRIEPHVAQLRSKPVSTSRTAQPRSEFIHSASLRGNSPLSFPYPCTCLPADFEAPSRSNPHKPGPGEGRLPTSPRAFAPAPAELTRSRQRAYPGSKNRSRHARRPRYSWTT